MVLSASKTTQVRAHFALHSARPSGNMKELLSAPATMNDSAIANPDVVTAATYTQNRQYGLLNGGPL